MTAFAPYRTEIVSGLAPVLARMAEIAALAAASQQDEVVSLPYLLSRPSRLHTRPVVILFYDAQSQLAGAVVLYEFGSILRGQRLFSCYSRRGLRTVFGPAGQRVALAASAAQILLARGARFVNLEIHMGSIPAHPGVRTLALEHARGTIAKSITGLPGQSVQWALHGGTKHFELTLFPSLERTLAPCTANTRRNLRRYRLLCEQETGCRYHPAALLDRESFDELDRNSSFPPSRAVSAWRYESLSRFPDLFLAGLRQHDGRWLSLAGCRREGTRVTMDWQMNRAGCARYSLGNTLRGFLIEHEALNGSTSLSFEGGTPRRSLFHSFPQHSVYNLAVRRHSLLLRLTQRLLVLFYPKKFVTHALVKPWRRWVDVGAPKDGLKW